MGFEKELGLDSISEGPVQVLEVDEASVESGAGVEEYQAHHQL